MAETMQEDLFWEPQRLYGDRQVIARCLGSCPAWPGFSSAAWLQSYGIMEMWWGRLRKCCGGWSQTA